MASEFSNIEVVVSSWPFRTGTVIYDPDTGMNVITWTVEDLREMPDVLAAMGPMLDPFASYQDRAQKLLDVLNDEESELLEQLFNLEGFYFTPIRLVLADDVPRALGAFCRDHGLPGRLLGLHRTSELMDWLEAQPIDKHHALVADWWERFARPAGLTGTSAFRNHTRPDGGTLFMELAAGDKETAWDLMRRDAICPPEDFTLWTVLRSHYGWRLELSDAPRPKFPAVRLLYKMFRETPKPASA